MADIKTTEEIAAEQARAAADAQAFADTEAAKVIEPLTKKDEEIAKLKDERDNYRKVALKRLGKLPGDADFLEGADKETGLTVSEQIRQALIDREITEAEKAKDSLIKDQTKKISELTLALKNRPSASLGGGSGDALEVKDNVLSEAQIANLKARATRLKVKDVDAFIETAKQNILRNR